jgi:hypothetical protein
LVAATKETYGIYGEAIGAMKRYLDPLPGGDFTGVSSPFASLQDGGDALSTALDLASDSDAKGTIDCQISAR